MKRLAFFAALMTVVSWISATRVVADEVDLIRGLTASNQNTATSPAEDENTDARRYTSLDQYTAPFQMRVAGQANPIASASAGSVTIRVRGLEEAARRSGTLRCEVVRVEDGSIVKRIDERIQFDGAGDAEPVTVLENAPDTVGVYEVRCRLLADRNPLWSRIAGVRTLGEERRFPLLIVSDATATRRPTNTVFEATGAVVPYDPEAWHAPAWVPDGASKLVPKVNQLVPDPWHSDSRAARPSEVIPEVLGVIEPNGEHVCKLPQLNANCRYLLSFAVEQRLSTAQENDRTSTDAIGVVEVACDPGFESIARKSSLSLPRYLSDADNQQERFELLHYSCGGQEFVRVRNPSDRDPLVLRSIEVFEAQKIESVSRVSPPHRRISLRVTEPNWRQRMTTDIMGLKELGFASSTIEMFRVQKSANRFAENATWLGYDAVMVPESAEDEFVRAHAVPALRSWLAADGIGVNEEVDGVPDTASNSSS
ncbi:MAG: hypothetical protein AAFU85_15650, partial [Planctomycetota bacterium]